MDLQTSQTAPAGGYAFAMNGADVFVQADAIGGILNIDSPGTISGTGSVADQNLAGTLIKKAAITGTVSDPDSFGVVKFVLHTPISPAAIRLTGYIVDATHIKLIETDLNVNNGTGASTGGVAIAQGAATGTFTDNSALSGRFVVALQGTDLSGISGTLTAAGTFTSDGAGKFTSGFLDETLLGIGIQIDDQMTATYGVDPSGNGRTAANIKFKNNGPGPQFIFYLTGNGNPPLFLDSDITFGAVGFGTAYPAVDATFDGKYGIGYTQNVFGSETDATGPVTVDGTAQTITGFVDTNFFFTPVPNTVISGTFATTNFPGRLKGNLTNELFQVAPDGGIAVNYYMYDSDHGFFVENDSLDTSQVTFGSFVRRTPVCPDCP
jgi:hypothetical protein